MRPLSRRLRAVQGLLLFLFLPPILGCSEDDKPSAPTIDSEARARAFAYAVKSAVGSAAPDAATATWNSVRVQGTSGGYAIVDGSFSHVYDSRAGFATETYDDVVIEMHDFCSDSTYPHLTGAAGITGTCRTDYGWSTTHSGSWFLVTNAMKLTGSMTGAATLEMELKEGGLVWVARVTTGGKEWIVTP